MRNIMYKEIRLSASFLSFLFILFGLLFLVPGYPVLCSVFFVTLGIFQSFQSAREANDIVFSALLPVAKKDVVRGKYMFVCMIELCAAVLMAAAVIIRMTVFAKAPVYVNNALMNANLFALGIAFVIFGLFNLIFVGGFFTTAYKFARPFVIYIITAFTLICIAEALHYFPGLQKLNAFGTDEIGLQSVLLISGIVIWLVLTWLSCRKAYDDFERIDL